MSLVSVKKLYEPRLLMIPGVVGVGADLDEGYLVVYVSDKSVCNKLPKTIEGYPVKCERIGGVRI